MNKLGTIYSIRRQKNSSFIIGITLIYWSLFIAAIDLIDLKKNLA